MKNRLFWIAIGLFGSLGFALFSQAGGPAELKPGQIYDARIPHHLRAVDANEGYFYTHGPVSVMAHIANSSHKATVVIRDPAHPDPPVAQGTVEQWFPFETTLPSAGFYYVAVSSNDTYNIRPQVLAGVSNTRKCNGYYLYRALPESSSNYLNDADATKWFVRSTDGCDNSLYVFSPAGASSGWIHVSLIDSVYWNFSLTSNDNYYHHESGNLKAPLEVTSGNEVMVLARDDQGYFVPPYATESSSTASYYTYLGEGEYLNIHSFADGTSYHVYTLQMTVFGAPMQIASGTLDEGQTYTHTGAGPTSFHNVLKVRTTKGQAAVSVLGGDAAADNTNYMTYALDPSGNMQGGDFITRSHFGGAIYVTGLENGTTVDVWNASTGAFQSTQSINQAQIVNVNPGTGIWRIRSNKDVTVCVTKGYGGSFIPLTKNVTGSTPFPPVIAGVNWTPLYPRTSNTSVSVRWLTDELATTKLHYKIGGGAWQQSSLSGFRTEHSRNINISGLSQETIVRFRCEATDQSDSTTLDDNDGADYTFTVRKDAPDLAVSLLSVQDRGSHYTLTFRVDNEGDGEARNTFLRLRLRGLQPFTDGVESFYTNVSTNRIDAMLPVGTLYPGSLDLVELDVMPYLSHTGGGTYRLESCTSIAEDVFGHTYNESQPSVTQDWPAATVEARMANRNYVILANLVRFFSVNSSTDPAAQAMPRKMAAFAVERDAVLAYIATGNGYTIRDFIQGRFNGKISSSWRDGGYLLLVGCNVVMPSWDWNLHCTWGGTDRVSMSDNTYANLDNDGHYTPELCIGRITGNGPGTYVSLFERALVPHSFDKAISISGTGEGEGSFSNNASECRNRLAVLYPQTPAYYRLNDWAQPNRQNVYLNNANNADFVYYRNHGSVGGWDDFWSSTVPSMSFGGKFPIIYSNACLTGRIQDSGDLAEAFLDQSAAVFIGATEVSPRSQNNSMGNKITGGHRDGKTIGKAFRDAKRSLAGDIHWYTTCYQDRLVKREILMYNLYGDPMRGGSSGSGKPSLLREYQGAPTGEIALSIPMYEVEIGSDGLDHVTLPDDEHGDDLLLINEPIVPIYRWVANYARGIRVNGVQMASRSGQSNQSGLTLPTAWGDEKTAPGPDDLPSEGDFPTDDFHWTCIELPGGGIEFVLSVHPFFYNAKTGDATFYQDYTFKLDLVESSVFIEGVTPSHDSAPIGTDLKIGVELFNDGATAQTVNLIVDIVDMGEGHAVATLSVNGIGLDPGVRDTQTVVWDTSGQAAVSYQVTARVEKSASGEEQDVAYARFRLGTPSIHISSLYFNPANPGYVGDAEDVDLGMTVSNTGDIPVSGVMRLRMQRVDDGYVHREWECAFEDLVIKSEAACAQVWGSTGIPPGAYYLSGWAEHDGGVTELESIPFQTLDSMRLGWSLPRSVYRRGDKIMATADLFNSDGTNAGRAGGIRAGLIFINFPWPVELELDEHSYAPHYSTSFVTTAAIPNGKYALITDATKTGYHRVTVFDQHSWGRFVLSDFGFETTAAPGVCPADGFSTIAVTSGVVEHGGIPIPDGTLITLDPWGGSILAEDADPAKPLIQIPSSGGRYEFEWLSPTRDWPDAFLFGAVNTGDATPMTGLSAVFKAVDFNDNRRVDAFDILFVQSGGGALWGTSAYDRRKDMNDDGITDGTDTQAIVDRWALEFSDAVRCSTCSPEPGPFGVTLRPVPERATLLPGAELAIEIVADGLENLGGYEFGGVLTGSALVWAGTQEIADSIAKTGNERHPLGPVPYDDGYRLGAYAAGENSGPGGSVKIATLHVQANELGESRLILSAPVFARMDGTEQSLKLVREGVYIVALATETPTPSPTATMSETPTATSTQTPSPSPSATATETPTATASGTSTPTATDPPATPTSTATPRSGDTNGDGWIDGKDLFFFSNYWQQSATEENSCNPVIDEQIDEEDLLYLIREWKR